MKKQPNTDRDTNGLAAAGVAAAETLRLLGPPDQATRDGDPLRMVSPTAAVGQSPEPGSPPPILRRVVCIDDV
jgi:hypothetical protein